PPSSPLFPYTTLFRSRATRQSTMVRGQVQEILAVGARATRKVPAHGVSFPEAKPIGRVLDLKSFVRLYKAVVSRNVGPVFNRARSEEHTSELQSRRDL